MEAADLNFSFIKMTNNLVDYENRSVTSRFLWGKSKAIYREGFGVTLLRDIEEEELRSIKYPSGLDAGYDQDTIDWPLGNIIPDTTTGIDVAMLDSIGRMVISGNDYKGNIYSFLVMHKGIPVLEAYKPGFNSDTRFLSWSMAKSFTNAIVGMLVMDGKMNITERAELAEWSGDERSKITLNDLLQMKSGLKWNEDYGNRSDVTVMLHCESDMGRFAYEQEAEYPAGSHWYYSSGTTNIVSDLIQREFDSDSACYAYVKTRLFNRIGMPDAILEVDPSGSFVGSSYLYATARYYARFALLCMNDGVFNGERILPEGWIDYSTDVAEGSNGNYGAFFWLNRGKRIVTAPEDMFSCNGHDGQYIFMIPSREIAIVILGYSPDGIELEKLIGDVLKTL